MDKETSSRVSSIAAHYLKQSDREIEMLIETNGANVLKDIRTLAASCLSQDETPGQSGAPEFTTDQLATDPILHFFHYAHLPEKLRATSRLFFILAASLVSSLPRNPERTVALRKLLEAKDAAVRANLPAPTPDRSGPRVASPPALGDPVETGGHDEDRDGPVPFDV